jgi:hypothetical protein
MPFFAGNRIVFDMEVLNTRKVSCALFKSISPKGEVNEDILAPRSPHGHCPISGGVPD